MSFYQKINYVHYEISSLCLNEMIGQKSTKESPFSRIHFGMSFLARVSLLTDFDTTVIDSRKPPEVSMSHSELTAISKRRKDFSKCVSVNN